MYPDEEFLPRAPDPEELILDGDDEPKNNDNKTEEEEEASAK